MTQYVNSDIQLCITNISSLEYGQMTSGVNTYVRNLTQILLQPTKAELLLLCNQTKMLFTFKKLLAKLNVYTAFLIQSP